MYGLLLVHFSQICWYAVFGVLPTPGLLIEISPATFLIRASFRSSMWSRCLYCSVFDTNCTV